LPRKLVLIHGYSDQGPSFDNWAEKFRARGIDAEQINICNYISLNNEITIPDIAEGLARAAAVTGWQDDQEFDAVVHSTGILVVRAWLANNPARRKYLKHLIGLAPATWGSPLAAAGRSWLGAIVRGNKQFGPDFLNAGDQILDALELGSKFQWDLSRRDLLGENPLFTTAVDTPYVSVFIGNHSYDGIRELVNKPGTDGTVRWSGCSLNARKVTVDLTKAGNAEFRAEMSPWPQDRLSVPMFPVMGKNHTSLLVEPEDDLADILTAFLKVSSGAEFNEWLNQTRTWSSPALEQMKSDHQGPFDGWQQFIIHVVDEFGNPVPDYVVDLFNQDPTNITGEQLQNIGVAGFDLDVHEYKADSSFRCFHVRLPQNSTTDGIGELWMRLIASSGTDLITYQGYTLGSKTVTEESPVVLDITHLVKSSQDPFFHPFVTTLVEIQLSREPLPLVGQTRLMTMNPLTPKPPANHS
jgi:hypothetical protein